MTRATGDRATRIGCGDRGSGAVLVLVAVAIVACVAGAVLVVSGGIDARRRAQSAADLAAIAAAVHSVEGPAPACRRARSVAHSNGAELRWCDVVDGIARVEVVIRSSAKWLREPFVGRARAGPSSAPVN